TRSGRRLATSVCGLFDGLSARGLDPRHGQLLLAARQVPDHVGFADALELRLVGDGLPRQLGLGEIVPARELERLEGTFEVRSDLALNPDQFLECFQLAFGETRTPYV